MSNFSEFRHVLVVEDQKSRRIVSLKESTYCIGRDPNNSIPLYDRQVSRHHATFLRVNDYQNNSYLYRVIDGNLQGKRSTNGIMVNGKYCLSHELKHGDIICFGSKSKASYHVIAHGADLDLLQVANVEEFKEDNSVLVDKFIGEKPTQFTDSFLFTENDLSGVSRSENSSALLVANNPPEKNHSEDLSKGSSLAEYSPHPIIELNFEGQITYLNPAASVEFPELKQSQAEHPILQGIIAGSTQKDGTSFVREIQVNQCFFEQHIYYLSENQLIRSYLIEISKYKQIESKLKAIQDQYKLMMQQTSEGLLIVDSDNKQILEVNPAYCNLIGYRCAELLEMNLYQMIVLEREMLDQELAQVNLDKPYLLGESFHRCQDGSFISVATKINRTFLGGKQVFCLVIQDISERKKSEEKLQYQALHDPLTNLPNRVLFKQQLVKSLAHAQKHQHLMAVIFLDIDSFKHINNTLGHSIGDRILHQLGQRLNHCVQPGDVVARWGGDEFCLLLPHIKNTEDTVKLSQRIFESLKQPFEIDKHQLQIKISIGIAIYPQDGEEEETLLKNADTALHQTKEKGRNHYQFYNPTMTAEAVLLLRTESLLHQALEKKQFSLHYQPQIQTATGKITGMEALLRWQNPEVGLILPGKLIPLAAKTDLIFQISKWVLKTACTQNLAWQKDGLPPFPIAVNLSAKEFQQANLAEIVAKILDETGLDPHWLELEITEMTLRQNLNLAQKTIRDLQEIGVRIALDDFGRGVSALGYLQQFSFHTLKIDQLFIRDLKGNSQELALIEAVLSLGRGFHIRVIAEGVETEEQFHWLKQLNCEEIQGYWFSRPLNTKEATQFLGNRV